jgi:hypothetical protein
MRPANGIPLALNGDMTGLRRACLPVIALVLSSAQAFAQEAVVEAGTSVGAIHAAARADSHGKVRDWKYWGLAAGLNGAMLVDTKSTFDVLRECGPACREANPVVAPFVRRGPALTYAAGMLFDAGVMTVAAKMRASPRGWVRRTWWVAPAALIVGHSIAARHNANLLK